MRTPNLGSIQYTPNPFPENKDDIPTYLQRELTSIQLAITALVEGHLDKSHSAPTKPREGDIRLADGTNWNPGGGGQGVYCYYNSTWNRLG